MGARNMLETLEGLDKRGRSGFSGGRFYAWSVKCHKSADECSEAEFEDVRGDRALDSGFCPEWIRTRFADCMSAEYYDGVERSAQEDAWEGASEILLELASGVLDSCTLEADGRSGGWAVLRGLDADALEECAGGWTSLEEARESLRTARAKAQEQGPLDAWEEADALVHALEETLEECADFLGLEDYLERLRASTHPEDLEPETDSGREWSREELVSIVGALGEWGDFVRSSVSDFPRLILWHCAGVYEDEKEAERLECLEFERVEREEDARGALVSALLRTADACIRVRFDGPPEEEWRAYEKARSALASALPRGERFTLRRVL